jgi:hypothetical protein
MAERNWPSELPCPTLPIAYAIDGFVVEDAAEIGAPRARARFTRSLRRWTAEIAGLTRAHCDQLEEFWRIDLNRGSLSFNIPAPRARPDGQPYTIEARIVGGMSFTRAGLRGGERWTASLSLQEV